MTKEETSRTNFSPVFWRRLIRAYLPLLILWGIYYLSLSIALDNPRNTIKYSSSDALNLFQSTAPTFVAALTIFLFVRLIFFRKAQPLGEWIKGIPWLEVLVFRFVPSWAFAFVILKTFVLFKPHIPELNPFSWDSVFADLDQLLLFGWDAWELTHAMFPGQMSVQVLDRFYGLWFHVLFACVSISAVLPLDSRLRLTFLIAFALNWMIGGSLLATVFSSAGPVYYERLFDLPVYIPLTDALQGYHAETPLFAVQMAENLWKGYEGVPGFAQFGISAFPSLHLGTTAMIACFAFAFGRLWGLLGCVYTMIILIGSVHLAWHYLVDGIAGVGMALIFWGIGRAFSGWWLTTNRSTPDHKVIKA